MNPMDPNYKQNYAQPSGGSRTCTPIENSTHPGHTHEWSATDEAELPNQTQREPALALLLCREVLQVVLPALLLALIIHVFLAQATVVYGRSMEPNLYEAQRLIIDKISYRFRTPQRNDIVVLDLPTMDEMLVKRIVGLPGETIEIHDGQVFVNNVPLPETFPHNLTEYDTLPVTLGPLSYFVLGDNRGNSNDSRAFGSVKREYIVGRVWLRYWPLHQFTLF